MEKYKNDTPESIMANSNRKYVWLSSLPVGPPSFGSLINPDGLYYGRHQAHDPQHSQRPVLLHNIYN